MIGYQLGEQSQTLWGGGGGGTGYERGSTFKVCVKSECAGRLAHTLHDSRVVLTEEAMQVLVHEGCEAGSSQRLVVVVEDHEGSAEGVQTCRHHERQHWTLLKMLDCAVPNKPCLLPPHSSTDLASIRGEGGILPMPSGPSSACGGRWARRGGRDTGGSEGCPLQSGGRWSVESPYQSSGTVPECLPARSWVNATQGRPLVPLQHKYTRTHVHTYTHTPSLPAGTPISPLCTSDRCQS